MASLHTLRTKYGVILSVIIVLALLAFIISLGPEMGFLGNKDPKVGEINGEKVTYMEYLNEYEATKANAGGDESTEEASAMLANATWQSLIAKHFLTPGFEKIGLQVSEAERMAMLSGEIPTQVIYQAPILKLKEFSSCGFVLYRTTSTLSKHFGTVLSKFFIFP